MTYRLTPVGSCGGAEAILADMPVEITHDDVIGDVAGSGREVAPAPEPLPPVALTDMLELLLDFARRTSLCPAHEVADRDMRWYFHEHMDVIARQGTVDDGHTHLSADLPDDLAHSDPDLAMQHFEPILRCPDDMVTMMKSRVTTLTDRLLSESKAEASIRLK